MEPTSRASRPHEMIARFRGLLGTGLDELGFRTLVLETMRARHGPISGSPRLEVMLVGE